MNKYLNSWFLWLFCNGLFACVLWQALFMNSHGFQNLLKFLVWVMILIMLPVMFAGSDNPHLIKLKKKLSERGALLRFFSVAFDLAVTFIFAFYGWFFYAGIYFFHFLIQQSLYPEKENS